MMVQLAVSFPIPSKTIRIYILLNQLINHFLNLNYMKKIIYILLIGFTSLVTFSSCTEEEVKPTSEFNGGGGPSDPK